HCLVPSLAEGKSGVDTAVIELDALADADGPAAEDQYFLAVGRGRFVLLVVSGVEIGRVGLKLCGAGIDALVGGSNSSRLTVRANHGFVFTPELRQVSVREAVCFGPTQRFVWHGLHFAQLGEFALLLHQRLEL